jgi:ATP-binding cassette subfamily B protein
VLAAVGCSVSTQYAVKFLVDTLAEHAPGNGAWRAFLLLACLITSDCLLWRLASWIANFTFVAVTGDLRRDLFRHLTGQCTELLRTDCPERSRPGDRHVERGLHH